MSELCRRYDLGGGVMIEDNGYTIVGKVKTQDGGTSCGIKRPRIGPMPTEVEVKFSESGKHYYLTGYFAGHWWLGVKAWDSKEEMQAQQAKGIMGAEGAEFTIKDKTHYREVLHFSRWKVHSGRDEMRPVSDELVQDYLVLVQQRDRENEKRFNEVIAPSGRTLKWVMDKIGEWQPINEVPVVVLT